VVVKFSIVIPNWNGQKLLEKNLPKVLETGADEVIVVDNGSTDGSLKLLQKMKRKSSMVRTIELKKNYGFSYACNLGVKEAKSEIVVLLNNDVVPEKGFFTPLVEDFQDPKVFAVSLGEPQWSWAKGKWIKGFVEHKPGPRTKTPHISFWASGGSAAFRKSIWEKLGGFDEIYKPFYWEDFDLSYRAWKRGYKVMWDPCSIVHHQHEETIRAKFSKRYVDFISQRNQLLFIWKNITTPKMMIEHKIYLWKRLLTQPRYWRTFLAALVRLPQILPARLKEFREKKVSDKEIFQKFV
jgi:GT2 family glycosyltransferase